MQIYTPQIGDKIAVKRFGYVHVGIYVGPRTIDGREVVHNDKGNGVVFSSLADFSSGGEVFLQKRATDNYFEREAIANRAFSLIGKNFDLFNFNCEHAANLAQTGQRESPQLQGALVCVLAIFILGLLAKQG
jgi:hypothetical protein